MRLEFHHKGRWIKHHEWPSDMKILVLSVCQGYIVFRDNDDPIPKVMERNDSDMGWEFAEEKLKEEL